MVGIFDSKGESEVRNMAESRIITSSLRLILHNGTNPKSGAAILKRKTFSNVKTDANADQLFAVANALAPLQELPLYGIERMDNSDISEF